MRVAVANWTRRKVGGAETYLQTLLPSLSEAGLKVGFWHEVGCPEDCSAIRLAGDEPVWCADEGGAKHALAGLRDWRPDIIYAHGFLDPKIEARLQEIAPSVFYVHNYYGMCVSGSKTFSRPLVTPCHRRFGAACLIQYFPRGCGGRNPLSLLANYQLQSQRLRLLRKYVRVLTNSTHMVEECSKHAVRARLLPYPVAPALGSGGDAAEVRSPDRPWQILFLGRMDRLKGGRVLLDSLPAVAARLDRPLRVMFAGNGPDRPAWERRSDEVTRRFPKVAVEFVGWVNEEKREKLLGDADLLVVPSSWPEPFGLTGAEAGLRGLPVAAFDVGGVREWLKDGVNGHLAPGDPPTAAGLADAVVACLADPAHRLRLGRNGRDMAARFSRDGHLRELLATFHEVVG
jgi:glycosyltransferase involved in cell wall biosynthesis